MNDDQIKALLDYIDAQHMITRGQIQLFGGAGAAPARNSMAEGQRKAEDAQVRLLGPYAKR